MFFDEASEIHEKEVDQLQRIGGRLIIPKVGIRLFLKVLEMGGEQCFKEFSFMRKMAIQCSLTDASHSGNLCHRHGLDSPFCKEGLCRLQQALPIVQGITAFFSPLLLLSWLLSSTIHAFP